MYAFLRGVMRVIVVVYLAGLFKVSGTANVPTQGPLIICPNHIGTIDPPLVPAFVPRGDTWSMAKSEYFRNPVINWLFTNYHAFPVVRHTADRVALRRAFDLLKEGHALVIYPEGTRIDSGVLAKPEPGAGFIAQRCACPVLPVADVLLLSEHVDVVLLAVRSGLSRLPFVHAARQRLATLDVPVRGTVLIGSDGDLDGRG